MLGPIYVPIQQPKPSPVMVQRYANGLTVTAPRVSPNLVDHTVEWSGGVTATYGPTVVVADRFIVHDDPESPFGEAIGTVKVTDPEGRMTASYLKFYWVSHSGTAQNVSIQVSMLSLTAESIDIKPDLCTLHNVGATGCKLKTPLYYIHTRELQVRPGIGATAIRPELSLFGHKLVALPTQRLSASGGGNSIDLPYPTLRSGSGFGINWTNEMSLNARTGLFSKYAIFQRALPYYNATVVRSGITGRDPEPLRTEIGDRFTFGYFDNVQVRDPKAEHQYFSARRFDYGLETTWGADARDTTNSSAKINKPIEAMVQASGEVQGFGIFSLARAQQVQVGGGPTINRLILEENLLTPSLSIARNLSVFARADAAAFTGGNSYGWLRGQAGIVFQPSHNLRFGASYTAAKAHGTPDFGYDVPLRFRELSFRADLDFDTTQIRLLVKYDPSHQGVFDRELYLSRVVGCLEPYIVYRERPHKFFIGLKLPIARVFEHLSKEELDRKAAIRTTLSGTPRE